MTVFALHHLLSRAAAASPEREAVRCRGRSLSYRDLDAWSNGVARALVDGGVARGDRVGIFVPKDLEAVAAVYGVMKAGAAYVPLDPKQPVLRAARVLLGHSQPVGAVFPYGLRALAAHVRPPAFSGSSPACVAA